MEKLKNPLLLDILGVAMRVVIAIDLGDENPKNFPLIIDIGDYRFTLHASGLVEVSVLAEVGGSLRGKIAIPRPILGIWRWVADLSWKRVVQLTLAGEVEELARLVKSIHTSENVKILSVE